MKNSIGIIILSADEKSHGLPNEARKVIAPAGEWRDRRPFQAKQNLIFQGY
jgi:hypothetical protein